MDRKLFSLGSICFILLFFIAGFVYAQDSRPMVRLIYFLPKDRQPQPDINAKLDKHIKDTQQLFANQMEAHGFGRKTFQFETDAEGNAVVHHFIGEFTDAHYSNLPSTWTIWNEIDKQFDPSKNIYLTVIDMSSRELDGGGIAGRAASWGSSGGLALVTVSTIGATAHELGHTFGLDHDYRPNAKRIWKYTKDWMLASFCAAEWLDVHPAFNPERQQEQDERSHFKMFPLSLASPPNVIRLRFEISDPNGINQVQLFAPNQELYQELLEPGSALLGCKYLNGNISGTVEFVTNDLTPKTEYVWLRAIDVHGNVTRSQRFPIDITPLLPRSETISIPDPHLAAAVQREIGNATTTQTMLNLLVFNVLNSGIADLTGIEYAHNLRWLNLGAEYIEDEGYVNSNTVSDLQPLSRLTNLHTLWLEGNNISGISALSGLTNLIQISFYNNNISDISALSTLKNLTSLTLSGNNISDISALSELTSLTHLQLGSNNISDISALSELTSLTSLSLHSNNISDISALSALTSLNTLQLYNNNISDISPLLALNLTGTERDSTGLYLGINPLSYTSINTHIPALQAKGVEVQYDPRTPTKLLKISGDAQQAVTNSELPFPFVVEVQDQRNRAFAEVPITFSITNGNGKLSTLTTTTDTKGRAKTRLTLGQTEGETTIRATAAEISQPVQFTVKAILPTSFVQLPDTNLTAKIAETLGKPTHASMTAADMLTLTSLTANNSNISNLTGLQHASNLTTLTLDGNNLFTIDLLTGLTQLTTLSLDNNNLSNIAPLVELAQLETLSLENNNLSDIAPLVELTKLKTLRLRGNLLSYPSLYTTIPTLRSSSVDVEVDTRTPTTLINIPGTPGVAGETRQVLVQVEDQNGIAFAGVPVTFTLTAADGHLSTSEATSNLNGEAITTLTLGLEPGENVVNATVTEIQQPLTFRITTVDANTLVHIPDVNLRAKIAETLNKPKNATLNAGDVSALTTLDARNANIQDLTGIEYAHNLIFLNLAAEYIEGKGVVNSNTVSDLQPLSGLTNLHTLSLEGSNISDISALSGLTNLTSLWLQSNNISDISALSTLTSLTRLWLLNNIISDVSPIVGLNLTGTSWNSTGLHIRANPLSYASINTHIPAMQARGIEVQFDVRTPTNLVKISGAGQQGITNTLLPLPFVVEVRDQRNKAFAGVPVTFTVATGDSKLSATSVPTDAAGRASAHLTMGQTPGTTTVRVMATEISQPVQFTATAALLNAPVTVSDAALHAAITSALGKSPNSNLTVSDMLKLTTLTVNSANIRELTGLEHASNLTTLSLNSNNLSDIAPLTGLFKLTTLSLNNNRISNVAPLAALAELQTLSLENNALARVTSLSGLTKLKILLLDNNRLADVSPFTGLSKLQILLVNNNNLSDIARLTSLRQLKMLGLKGNLLSYPSLHTHIPALQAQGATVRFDPRTPTTLVNVSGMRGVAGTAHPIGVEVQDAHGFGFSGVPVTFTVTAGGGQLDASNVIADSTGRARTTLTLGPVPGKNTIRAAAAEVLRPVSFSITTVDTNSRVIVRDANLRTKIIATLGKTQGVQLTAGDMLGLTRLDAQNANIQDLTGIEYAHNLSYLNLGDGYIEGKGFVNSNAVSDLQPLSGLTNLHTLYLHSNNISDISALSTLTNLNTLRLQDNNISDISALSTLTNLNTLWLQDNNISDISALSTLTSLTRLWLWNNIISDVSPIVELNLTGTEWDTTGLYITGNPLSYASINTHIPAMQAKGIEVKFDNRAHSVLVKISEDTREGEAHTTLVSPFVVKALDEHGATITGRSVTFRISEGNGRLSVTNAITDAEGRAQTTLTLGPDPGMIKIRVTAAQITYPVIFTVIVTEATRLAADVNGDGTVNIQDLVLVASNLGQTGENASDVNGDGVVNIQDLVRVAGALGDGAAAAPSLHASDLEGLTAADIQQMLTQARQLALTDPAYLRGIAVLERLLARLLPKETTLLPNYPNPFNPETWIPYQLSSPSDVMVRIYAVNGNLVRRLVLGHKATGIYQTRSRAAYWDGKNQIGEPVASGVYFYTLTAGDFNATRRMLILK